MSNLPISGNIIGIIELISSIEDECIRECITKCLNRSDFINLISTMLPAISPGSNNKLELYQLIAARIICLMNIKGLNLEMDSKRWNCVIKSAMEISSKSITCKEITLKSKLKKVSLGGLIGFFNELPLSYVAGHISVNQLTSELIEKSGGKPLFRKHGYSISHVKSIIRANHDSIAEVGKELSKYYSSFTISGETILGGYTPDAIFAGNGKYAIVECKSSNYQFRNSQSQALGYALIMGALSGYSNIRADLYLPTDGKIFRMSISNWNRFCKTRISFCDKQGYEAKIESMISDFDELANDDIFRDIVAPLNR